MSLVERGGKVRSRHVADVTAKTLKPILVDAIAKDTDLRTDQSPVYTEIGKDFASHETVNHSIKEYVRGDAHTNTVEGYFSIFKRGIYGVYHHVSEQHLKRYLCEFDFRYNERIALGVTDTERDREGDPWRGRKAVDLSTASWSGTGVGVNGGSYAATYA